MSECNFHFVNAHMYENLKIGLKNAKNGRAVVNFIDGKNFNNLFAKSLF